ncbi:MAG: FecR domain-containing protein, partial [Clostridia bacterium]|nr:FecR domain-containing protein [Clostridia bacterium]
MNRSLTKVLSLFASIIMILTLVAFTASAEESENEMHILNAQGEAEVIDGSGQVRTAGENETLRSGEILRTGEDATVPVYLSEGRTAALDAQTQVKLTCESNDTVLELIQGTVFLDVQRKLDEDESLKIAAGTATMNIQGTIVFASQQPAGTADQPAVTILGVLEGTAQIGVTDDSGTQQTLLLTAGEFMELIDANKNAEQADTTPVPLTQENIPQFVANMIQADPVLRQRVEVATDGLPSVDLNMLFPADGDWTYSGEITFVAQSASKIYDGTPLSRTEGVLVYGLPADFSVVVTACGSLTDAGACANEIAGYAIMNQNGEEVTSHFTNITTLNGQLVVEPAPLTVWTGSAEKTYDGEPLTSRKAEVKLVPWYSSNSDPLRNAAVSVQTPSGEEALVAVSGRTSMQVTDPLTGTTEQITLLVGQKASISYADENGDMKMKVITKDLSIDELPDEVLRLYGTNPELLQQACSDAGWEISSLKKRIAELSEGNGSEITTIRDAVSVQISMNDVPAGQNGRALSDDELHFVPIILDPTIRIVATGSQTEVGSSKNTYTIDWGAANKNNYTIQESLGTLTVLPPAEHTEEVILEADSADKVYDGEELTEDNVSVAGIPEGYSVAVTLSGSQTDVGDSENAISSYQIVGPDGNDVTDQFTNVKIQSGTLTVSPLGLSISCGGESVYYNGLTQLPVPIITYINGAHAGETVSGTRTRSADAAYRFTLFTGDTVDVTVSGGGKNADTYDTAAAVSGISCNASNFSISVSATPITVNPAELVIESPDGSKSYDGTPLGASPAKITGLASGDELFVEITGSQQNVGESDNTFDLIWGDNTLEGNYNIRKVVGTLNVTVNSVHITITANSAEKTYDGDPLSDSGFTTEGLPSACSVTADVIGEQTEIGSSDNVIRSYTIYD